MDIAKVDKNFAVEHTISHEGLCFYDAEQAPFRVYGVQRDDGCYRRMPEAVAAKVSSGVLTLHSKTAGGRLRFVTDSPRIAIRAEMDNFHLSPHFAFTGVAGFDLYLDGFYRKTFVPPIDMRNGFESVIDVTFKGEHEILIHFPLYAGVKRLQIGLQEGSSLKGAAEYRFKKPVVYYGSSITQGACASRPGNAYENIISRVLDCDHINLGFSGNAKAEDAIADYVASLSMSAFVYDYDHNAPTVEYLAGTHERMFRRFRAVQPDIPVLMLTRPKYHLHDEDKQRLAVVKQTYENALAAGDKNVYFIQGTDLVESVREVALVDNVHPNDAGFFSMANVIGDKLRMLLQ